MERFGGMLFWFDRKAKDPVVTSAVIQRAILRADELVLEFSRDGDAYHVALRPDARGRFRGAWQRGLASNAAHGQAHCKLLGHDNSADPDEPDLLLAGKWLDDIDWSWSGTLHKVETFGPPATQD
jgi:hypothetical protein